MRHVMKNLTILWKNNRTWKLEQCLWKCLLMKIPYGKIKCFQVCHSMRLFIVNLFILSGFTCASSGRSWFHSTTTPPWPQESGLDTMQHLWLQEAWIDLSNSLEYNETWGASKQKLRKMKKMKLHTVWTFDLILCQHKGFIYCIFIMVKSWISVDINSFIFFIAFKHFCRKKLN